MRTDMSYEDYCKEATDRMKLQPIDTLLRQLSTLDLETNTDLGDPKDQFHNHSVPLIIAVQEVIRRLQVLVDNSVPVPVSSKVS